MRLKVLLGTWVTAALVLLLAAPAWAHITVNPSAAPKGGEATIGFRVPNEAANANVVKVDIAFPTDHPLLGVDVAPIPGWTSTVTETKLDPPVQTDDGPVTQAVSEIAWTAASGGGLTPGQFLELPVLVQQLPTDTSQVVFKAVQTYSDATVVRWIDPVVAGQPAPDHPTPVLALTAPGDSSSGAAAATTPVAPGTSVDVSQLAQKSTVTTTETLAIVGVAFGALGVILALVAIARRPRDGTESAPNP